MLFTNILIQPRVIVALIAGFLFSTGTLIVPAHASTYGQCAYGVNEYDSCVTSTSTPTPKAKKKSKVGATTDEIAVSTDASPLPSPSEFPLEPSIPISNAAKDSSDDNNFTLILYSLLALAASAGLVGFIMYHRVGKQES
jgi:hypothetical protein